MYRADASMQTPCALIREFDEAQHGELKTELISLIVYFFEFLSWPTQNCGEGGMGVYYYHPIPSRDDNSTNGHERD